MDGDSPSGSAPKQGSTDAKELQEPPHGDGQDDIAQDDSVELVDLNELADSESDSDKPLAASRSHSEDELADSSDSDLDAELDEKLENLEYECDKHERKLLPRVVKPSDVHTTFEDVHVPPATVESLQTLTTLSLVRPDAFEYGVLENNRILGVLLYGTSGTGKTLLAKAVAKESGATMLEVSGADVMQQYVGEGEKVVRAIFSLARKLHPCIIFFDEADGVFRARSDGEKSYHRELINQFLKEWDGVTSDSSRGAFMMVATNRPYDLDAAVLRRLPRRILVDVPTLEDREAILKIHLKNEKLAPDVDLKALSVSTPNYSGSDLKHLCVSAALTCVHEETANVRRDPKRPRRLRLKLARNTFPARRTLRARHFNKALADVPSTVDTASMHKIRNFQKQTPLPKTRAKLLYGLGSGI